jgi:hypothetical protein
MHLAQRSGVFGMGVADGVYMWREQGIDSGVMSRAIMDSCRLQVQAGEPDVFKRECGWCAVAICPPPAPPQVAALALRCVAWHSG